MTGPAQRSLIATLLASWACAAAGMADTVRFGAFGTVHVARSPTRIDHVALLAWGDSVWNAAASTVAESLTIHDALVAGFCTPHYLDASQRSREACLYPAGDLENLSKFVQQGAHLAAYISPVIVGIGQGATLVYCAVAQAPPSTFHAALSVDFAPSMRLVKPMCPGSGLAGTRAGDGVVYFTGDGGWDVSDKGIGHALAAQGTGMVGVNSLKYFWTMHSPDSTARDVERVIDHYTKAWTRSQVVPVGYSFGADILPFVAARLRPDIKRLVTLAVVISPGRRADFSFHVGSWFGKTGGKSLPVLPEIKKLAGMPLICFYGTHDQESLGPELKGLATLVPLASGHRVGKSFEPVVAAILGATAVRP
jgi:type IV secretory pathway VirJ component